jgi:hypothetical protein
VALALWAVGLLAVTALSRFRLPHYGLPAYPALALLAARAWMTPRPRRLAAAHAALFAGLAVAAGAGWLSDGARFADLIAGATDVATRKSAAAGQAAPFPAWEAWRPLVGWAALASAAGALGMVAVLIAWRRRPGEASAGAAGAPDGDGDARGAGAAGGLAGMAVAVVTMLAVLPAAGSAIALVSDHRSVRGLARFLAARAGPDDVVVHEGPIEATGALEWYSGRRPVIVDGRRSVLGFGATRADARDVFWDAARLRAVWQSGRRVWIVTTREPARSLAASLPGARVAVAAPTRWLYVGPDAPLR